MVGEMSDPVPHVQIVVVDYDPRWPLLFAQERARVAAALAGAIESITHIGSTSVPGLPAKPIIDLLVTASRLGPPEVYVERLERLGYTFFPALGNTNRYMFGRGNPHTHHLHIVEHGGEEHARPLAFRNYLTAHAEVARAYADLKRALALRFPDDRQAYNAGKTDFIRSIDAITQWQARGAHGDNSGAGVQ